jgi:hypothetical protein
MIMSTIHVETVEAARFGSFRPASKEYDDLLSHPSKCSDSVSAINKMRKRGTSCSVRRKAHEKSLAIKSMYMVDLAMAD